ncbi:MAG: hypothetical protein HUJ83_06420 [Veillonella sp.]|nr:hypothetical protein [Veillonella sp.]
MKENLYVMFLLVAIQAVVVSCLFDFTFREILGVSWVVLIHVMLITQILDHVDNKGDDKK